LGGGGVAAAAVRRPAEVVARFEPPKAFVRATTMFRSPAGRADYRWARQIVDDVAAPTKDDA
jgi:hypothetical protein